MLRSVFEFISLSKKKKKDFKFSLIIYIVLIEKMIVELYHTVKNNFIY